MQILDEKENLCNGSEVSIFIFTFMLSHSRLPVIVCCVFDVMKLLLDFLQNVVDEKVYLRIVTALKQLKSIQVHFFHFYRVIP